jgi:hypothetical protein
MRVSSHTPPLEGSLECEPEIDGSADSPAGLPARVDRYGKAHARTVEMADFLSSKSKALAGGSSDYLAWSFRDLARKLRACGDYLVFRLYPALRKVRLHAARFCQVHQLCPLCAIRRGAKLLRLYLARFQELQVRLPESRAFFVTLTVKDGADLDERFCHLQRGVREMQKRRLRKDAKNRAPTVMRGVVGGVGSYEFKRGAGSGLWHPHFHSIMLSPNEIDAVALSEEWHALTGDSFIVDVRELYGESAVLGFLECFKYAVKFSDMPLDENYEAYCLLRGQRLVTSFGVFRGLDVSTLDDDVVPDDEPYIELLYRYRGGAYTFIPESRRVFDGAPVVEDASVPRVEPLSASEWRELGL